MTPLELRGLTKVYPGGVQALEPLNLKIEAGEFVVLVGPSGCGKSTLLRLIAGLEEVSSGEILLGDTPITKLPPADRDVAMVFQSYALYPHMTVAENMGFGLRMRKFARADREQRVRDAAVMLGLSDVLERRPGQLSGGQQQRVALGRAIVRHPRLFLFDEPLSNLDAALRASTRAELRRLHTELQATMLYVTHDQVEAMSMADRLVVMRNGVVQQVGRPLDVYQQPVNRFVAGFIGTPPMNILQGRVAGGVLEIAGHHWAANGLTSGEVAVGFRAEHLHLAGVGVANGVPVNVLNGEALGNEALITVLFADGQQAVARVAAMALPPIGASMWLGLDAQHAHFFDVQTGAALPGSLDTFAGDAAHQIALQERE